MLALTIRRAHSTLRFANENDHLLVISLQDKHLFSVGHQ